MKQAKVFYKDRLANKLMKYCLSSFLTTTQIDTK